MAMRYEFIRLPWQNQLAMSAELDEAIKHSLKKNRVDGYPTEVKVHSVSAVNDEVLVLLEVIE